MKRLYRSRHDRFLAGVCGGLGKYFEVDPVLVRLVWGIGILVTGCFPGIIGYIVAWAIVPEEPAGGVQVEQA